MANLLSNAIKFSPPDSEVVIRATHKNDTVEISVSDHGPGIPGAFEPHVFERFAQADQSTTRTNQKGGTGLGLSITKSIVEMHGGEIRFSSTREPDPDHGTTFTVIFPQWRENGSTTPAA